MKEFRYFEPKTTQEAVSILVHYGEEAHILAGGTNLVVELKTGRLRPICIINIKTITDIDYFYADSDGIHIGALIPLAEFSTVEISRRRVVPSVIQQIPMMLRKIIDLMATPQVRNIATLPGNLAWGSPAADSAPPLLALDAIIKLQGPNGEKAQPLDGFFLGPGQTALKPGELITEILIPAETLKKKGMSCKFMKRKANTLAICSTAVSLNKTAGNSIKDVRIAVGAVAPIPLRLKRVESFLEGHVVDEEILQKTREMVFEEVIPITDIRSTAWFRREVAAVLVERCIKETLN